MAEEAVEGEEKKAKSPLIKIIILVVVAIILMVGTVVGTMFFTGFFDKKARASVEAELEAALGAASGAEGAAGGHGDAHSPKPAEKPKDGKKDAKGKDEKPQPNLKKTPEAQRFDFTYYQMEKDVVSNLAGSRKVMQMSVALMTSYDERVFANVKKHEMAIRSSILDVLRQTTEADLVKPEFRKELAEKMRVEINDVLIKYENFGGIDAVHFTSFVVQ